MRMTRVVLLLTSHLAFAGFGFGLGVFALPILTAPPPATLDQLEAVVRDARFQGRFEPGLADSDWLHWGEGDVFVGDRAIAFRGRLAPGPDYRIYLSPDFVETEADFQRLKPQMTVVGAARGFGDQVLPLPAGVDPARYGSVIVWCEAFGQFITAARYRP